MKLISKLFLVTTISFFFSCSYFPEDIDRADVVEYEETLKYIKLGKDNTRGLIMYPGGLVDPASYVELFSNLELENLSVFIAKVPYNLSILDIDLGSKIRKEFPSISSWSLIGHSLGGAVACFELENNLDAYDNLILLAAYPSEGTDLKNFSGLTVSLAGTNDLVIDPDAFERSVDQFSNSTFVSDISVVEFNENSAYFYEIPGGNHAQFGNYGPQNGDGDASISREDQQTIVRRVLQKIL